MWLPPRARSNGRNLAAALALAVACGVLEQPAAADLFAEEGAIDLRLSAPLATVFRSRADPEYQEGTLAYRDAAGWLASGDAAALLGR